MSEQDYLSAIRELIKSEMIDVNTSINGEIVSYSKGFATVRPLASKKFKDGDTLPYPLIYKVPVRWASFNGGKCGFKAPIKAGDKVLIVFSQQAADGSDDLRRFDLTDAYALPVSNETSSGGGNNDDTIMWYGSASIRITAKGEIVITAPKRIIFNTPELAMSNNGGASAMNLIGSLTNNGKNISSTHTHTGVQTGGGTTGTVS